jgi:hypothetical protein
MNVVNVWVVCIVFDVCIVIVWDFVDVCIIAICAVFDVSDVYPVCIFVL